LRAELPRVLRGAVGGDEGDVAELPGDGQFRSGRELLEYAAVTGQFQLRPACEQAEEVKGDALLRLGRRVLGRNRIEDDVNLRLAVELL
jgi:hypothetical protein